MNLILKASRDALEYKRAVENYVTSILIKSGQKVLRNDETCAIIKAWDESLHPRDEKGRWTTGPGSSAGDASQRNYGSTDLSDAAAEIESGKRNSLADYIDKDGNLTPEREALHKEIIDKLLSGKVPVDGQATMTMLGGGPASGKSSVMNPDTANNVHAVTVDPDMLKGMLPGYEEMAKTSDTAAGFYHEESSALAKRFASVAFSENYDVVYDGTGDGSVKSVEKKIAGARAHGYKVNAKYVTIDTEEAVRRNQARYDDAVARGETPRLPKEDFVRECHAKVSQISIACASKFDSIEVWDNNGARGSQKLIAAGGNGQELKAVPGQEKAFAAYVAKGEEKVAKSKFEKARNTMANKIKSRSDLTGRQWNNLFRLVDAKVPKEKLKGLSEVESELYDSLWAESVAHEKKYGFWPVSELAEIEWEDPVLDIYKDPV